MQKHKKQPNGSRVAVAGLYRVLSDRNEPESGHSKVLICSLHMCGISTSPVPALENAYNSRLFVQVLDSEPSCILILKFEKQRLPNLFNGQSRLS